jgi:hypothetical protein
MSEFPNMLATLEAFNCASMLKVFKPSQTRALKSCAHKQLQPWAQIPRFALHQTFPNGMGFAY